MSVLTIRVLAKSVIAPLVSAGVDVIQQLPLNTISIVGTASDPDGTIASTLWTQTAGPAMVLNTPNDLVLQIDNLTVGNYTFQLTATDNDGLITSDSMSLTVQAANILPVVDAGVDAAETFPITSYALLGSATDADGTIASYSWAILSKPAGATPTFSPSANIAQPTIQGMNVAGTYTLQLTAIDNLGGMSSDTMVIEMSAAVTNAPTINLVSQVLDNVGAVMGPLGSVINTDGHGQPFKVSVAVSDLDNHQVTVNSVVTLISSGAVLSTDSAVLPTGNGTVFLALGALPIDSGVGSQLYNIAITATDVDTLDDTYDADFGLSSYVGVTINGGLPDTLEPSVINGCFTTYSGTFIVPVGQTGSLTYLLGPVGTLNSVSGFPLSNVGAGTYYWSVSLDNSGSAGLETFVTVNSTLSGGDTGALILDRTDDQHSNWDQSPC